MDSIKRGVSVKPEKAMPPKRDLVKAAVDQWDHDQRSRRRVALRRALGRSALFGVIVAVCLFVYRVQMPLGQGEISDGVLTVSPILAGEEEDMASIKKIAIAESRVMGVMRGRRLESRKGVHRLTRGVTHLSRHFDRKRVRP
jgi:hypothetical protein